MTHTEGEHNAMSFSFPFPDTITPPSEKTPSLSTLPKAELQDLLVITHFILVHYKYLDLSAHDVLQPIESSLLSRTGKPYERLASCLRCPAPPTLSELRSLVEDLAASGRFRDACTRTGHGNTIRSCARPSTVRDSRGVTYAWLRGCAGVSTRFLANERLLSDPLAHAEYLRRRGGRKDVFVSGWLVSRVESAERCAAAVKAEHEKAERLAEEQRAKEKERERRKQSLRQQPGRVLQGSRHREVVSYVESDEGSRDTGDDEFLVEEVLDGGSADDSEGSRDDGAVAVGRIRVQVSERAKRAERRARNVGLGKRLRSGKVMGDAIDQGCVVARRSKRLRGISA